MHLCQQNTHDNPTVSRLRRVIRLATVPGSLHADHACGEVARIVYLSGPNEDSDYGRQSEIARLAAEYAVQVWTEESRAVFSARTYEHAMIAANYSWTTVLTAPGELAEFNRAILRQSNEIRVLMISGWCECPTVKREISEAQARNIHVSYVDPARIGFSFSRSTKVPSEPGAKIRRPR